MDVPGLVRLHAFSPMQEQFTVYKRAALARFLKCDPLQLPLLACVLGNDFVDPTAFQKYRAYAQQRSEFQDVTQAVAEHLASLQSLRSAVEFLYDKRNNVQPKASKDKVWEVISLYQTVPPMVNPKTTMTTKNEKEERMNEKSKKGQKFFI